MRTNFTYKYRRRKIEVRPLELKFSRLGNFVADISSTHAERMSLPYGLNTAGYGRTVEDACAQAEHRCDKMLEFLAANAEHKASGWKQIAAFAKTNWRFQR